MCNLSCISATVPYPLCRCLLTPAQADTLHWDIPLPGCSLHLFWALTPPFGPFPHMDALFSLHRLWHPMLVYVSIRIPPDPAQEPTPHARLLLCRLGSDTLLLTTHGFLTPAGPALSPLVGLDWVIQKRKGRESKRRWKEKGKKQVLLILVKKKMRLLKIILLFLR